MSAIRHFLQYKDISGEDQDYLFARTKWIKGEFKSFRKYWPLVDRTLVMIFEKASTRTRLSFEAAMWRLGGGVISASDMRSSSASTTSASFAPICPRSWSRS